MLWQRVGKHFVNIIQQEPIGKSCHAKKQSGLFLGYAVKIPEQACKADNKLSLKSDVLGD